MSKPASSITVSLLITSEWIQIMKLFFKYPFCFIISHSLIRPKKIGKENRLNI